LLSLRDALPISLLRGLVRACGVVCLAGTRCEYVPVRSLSPFMAKDGPGQANHTACRKFRHKIQKGKNKKPAFGTWSRASVRGMTGGNVRGTDAARERTGTYSQRVPPVIPRTLAPLLKSQHGFSKNFHQPARSNYFRYRLVKSPYASTRRSRKYGQMRRTDSVRALSISTSNTSSPST